jgi:hypothetical protein
MNVPVSLGLAEGPAIVPRAKVADLADEEPPARTDMSDLSECWRSAFENAAGSLSYRLSVRQACKITGKIAKSGLGDKFGRGPVLQPTERSQIEEIYWQRGCSGPGLLVDVDMFMAVAVEVMYGSD